MMYPPVLSPFPFSVTSSHSPNHRYETPNRRTLRLSPVPRRPSVRGGRPAHPPSRWTPPTSPSAGCTPRCRSPWGPRHAPAKVPAASGCSTARPHKRGGEGSDRSMSCGMIVTLSPPTQPLNNHPHRERSVTTTINITSSIQDIPACKAFWLVSTHLASDLGFPRSRRVLRYLPVPEDKITPVLLGGFPRHGACSKQR